jgi:hypothetical protein
MNTRANIIFMTATVSPPPNAPFLSRTDPVVRLNDYRLALKYYLSLPTELFDRLVLVDNSLSDVSDLRRVAEENARDKLVEIISFDGNSHPAQYGRAYGEFKLIDHGLDTSRLIRSGDRFWKVTGRLQCMNLAILARKAPSQYELYADFKRHRTKWVDLRTYSCSVEGYRRLLGGRYPAFREDVLQVAPERFLFDDLMARRHCNMIIPRFSVQPHFRGFSGQFNTSLDTTRERCRRRIKDCVRRLAPWLWI